MRIHTTNGLRDVINKPTSKPVTISGTGEITIDYNQPQLQVNSKGFMSIRNSRNDNKAGVTSVGTKPSSAYGK